MSCVDCSAEFEPVPSCGWRCVYGALDVDTSAEDTSAGDAPRLAAATREDRVSAYRTKHNLGVST